MLIITIAKVVPIVILTVDRLCYLAGFVFNLLILMFLILLV